MSFVIRMGIPEMKALWSSLLSKAQKGLLKGQDKKLYKRLAKTLRILAENPRYPGLQSHEITALSFRYEMKVWQSYLENNTPSAGRLFWVYGPKKGDITVIGLEPHPDDKKDGFEKVKLSSVN